MMKFVNILFVVVVLVIAACTREECETVVRYKDPVRIDLTLGATTETFYGILCKLESIDVKMQAVTNDTGGVDSVLTAVACSVLMGKPNEEAVTLKLIPGIFAFFGSDKVREAQPFEHLRVMCNTVTITPESANITIWNSAFMQDCKPWED